MRVHRSRESSKHVSQYSRGDRCLSCLTYDSQDHPNQVLVPRPDCSHDENEDSHWDSDYCQCKLRLVGLHDNYKLHRKSQEEEEVELQKGNVDLKCQISSLHAKVGGNV